MREIKFRGRTSHGSWAFGLLTKGLANTWIDTDDFVSAWVDPETVGQYTGLKDRSGVEIYEGDVVRLPKAGGYWHGVVRWCTELPMWIVQFDFTHEVLSDEVEIIGNIHDNPELNGGGTIMLNNRQEVEPDIASERARNILGAMRAICLSYIDCDDCVLSIDIDLGLGDEHEPFDLCDLLNLIRGALR